MARRADGEGSIYKVGDRWKVVVSLGFVGGKRKRITRNARTRADAVAILSKLRGDIDGRQFIEPQRITVTNFVMHWLDTHIKAHRAPATEALYRHVSEKVIVPRLGAMVVQKVRPVHCQEFVDTMIAEKVASRIRQVAFNVLRRAMRHAIKVGVIAIDPTEDIAKPSHDQKAILPFTKAEADAILKAVKDTRWHALVMLALTCGLRQGELFGLPWKAVNLKTGKIIVEQQAVDVGGRVMIRKPKTKNSVRVIDLPPVTLAALKNHRAVLLQEGNAGNAYVFPAREGGLVSRSVFAHRFWKPLLDSLKLTRRGFHHTRHSYATLALGAGVPVHVVAKILGHAKASTTHNIYSHALDSQQADATKAMNRLFG